MLLPFCADRHQLRKRLHKVLQVALVVVHMGRNTHRAATHCHMDLPPREMQAAHLWVHAGGQLDTEEICTSLLLISHFKTKRTHAIDRLSLYLEQVLANSTGLPFNQ